VVMGPGVRRDDAVIFAVPDLSSGYGRPGSAEKRTLNERAAAAP
jgi:hypothetical protein